MDTDHAIFVIDLQDANKTLIFVNNFFCLLLFEGVYIIFQRQKVKKSHKIVEMKVFLLFLHGGRRIRIHTFDKWIRIWIREAQKHSDPDPHH